MKFKKEIATSMIALMIASSTYVIAALSASNLGSYPTMGGAWHTNALPSVVVGASAQTIDVVGAVDIMASLAAASTSPVSGAATGCSAISGKCNPNINLGSSSGTAINSLLGATLTKIQVPQLARGSVTNTSIDYTVYEQVKPPNAKVKTDTAQYTSLNGSI